jgi:RNA polymerase sigma-70 factor, ECF subfamily
VRGAGDPRAEFCELEYGRLVGMLTLYTSDRDLAAELAQEALARACRHWRRVRNMDAPTAWLYRVALNLANSIFARRRAERRAYAQAAVLDAPVPEHPGWDEVVALRQALGVLAPRQRAAVVLRYYADLPVAEVASLMRCRPGTVRALTHQGLQRLRIELAPLEVKENCDAG